MTDEWDDPVTREPEPLNRVAVAGLIGSVAVAVAGLFALPALTDGGLSFWTAFWLLCGVEFVAAVGAGVSILRLRTPAD